MAGIHGKDGFGEAISTPKSSPTSLHGPILIMEAEDATWQAYAGWTALVKPSQHSQQPHLEPVSHCRVLAEESIQVQAPLPDDVVVCQQDSTDGAQQG